MPTGLKNKNFYEVLELNKNCKPNEIKKSFLKLSKIWHPDRNNSKEAHETFIAINEAYTTLINPSKRQQYDIKLNSKVHPNPTMHTDYSWSYSNTGRGYQNNYRHKQHEAWKSKFPWRTLILPNTFVAALLLFCIVANSIELFFFKKGLDERRENLYKQSQVSSLLLEYARYQAELNKKNDSESKEAHHRVPTYAEMSEEYEKRKKMRKEKSES